MSLPRLLLAGLSGGSGKTIVTLGLVRAFVRRGLRVKPFKKGPDYIDAVWLGRAAGSPPVNLDPFLMPESVVAPHFVRSMQGCDLAVAEGNRGLFDGKDIEGSYSSAKLATLLDMPAVLVLDATKMTRTAAAVVHGVNTFEPGFKLAGVILNRTAGERHRSMARRTIETYTDVPVLGAWPKLSPCPVPERHMGLISDREFEEGPEALAIALDALATSAEDCCNLDALQAIAEQAPPMEATERVAAQPVVREEVVIGVVRDAALWFYYEENFEALRRAGARLVELSIISREPWPEIHGLYMGGGFPETHAEELSTNIAMHERLRSLVDSGMPVYAECGGFMALCKTLTMNGATYPMAGVLDVETTVCNKPQGLGYVEAEVASDNPYHPRGTRLSGHEFHYSHCPGIVAGEHSLALRLSRGVGLAEQCDGLIGGPKGNVFAGYTHIHALGAPWWAENFVRAAGGYAKAVESSRTGGVHE